MWSIDRSNLPKKRKMGYFFEIGTTSNSLNKTWNSPGKELVLNFVFEIAIGCTYKVGTLTISFFRPRFLPIIKTQVWGLYTVTTEFIKWRTGKAKNQQKIRRSHFRKFDFITLSLGNFPRKPNFKLSGDQVVCVIEIRFFNKYGKKEPITSEMSIGKDWQSSSRNCWWRHFLACLA